MRALAQAVRQIAEPAQGLVGVPVPLPATAVGPFEGAAPVDRRHEARQQVFLQVSGGGEARGVQQLLRFPPGCLAVHRPGQNDHQGGAQHLGEPGARRRVTSPQPFQDGVPHAGAVPLAAPRDEPVRTREIGGQVLDAEVGEFDAGGPHQRSVRGADRAGVLVPAAGQDQWTGGGVERFERRRAQGLRDLVEPVQHRQYQVGVDQRGGQRRAAGDPAGQVRVVPQEQAGQEVAQRGGGRVPRPDAEDHRHRDRSGGGREEVEGELDGQHRLSGAGPAEYHQSPGGDAPVGRDHAPEVAAQPQRPGRVPRLKPLDVLRPVHQPGRGRLPSHGERKGVVDASVSLLALPAAPDLTGQRGGGVGEHAGRRGGRLDDRCGRGGFGRVRRRGDRRGFRQLRRRCDRRSDRRGFRRSDGRCDRRGFRRLRRRYGWRGFRRSYDSVLRRPVQGVRELPPLLRPDPQGVRQQVQGPQPVVGRPARLQPANGAHTHRGPLRQLLLREAGALA